MKSAIEVLAIFIIAAIFPAMLGMALFQSTDPYAPLAGWYMMFVSLVLVVAGFHQAYDDWKWKKSNG